MRTFISIELPREIKKKIMEVQNNLPEFKGKKTEFKNLHLTLKFLGEIDEEKIEEIRKRLRKLKFNKFQVELSGLGVFSEKFIRIIWVHLNWAEKLQKIIDENLENLFKKEKRFMSHVTIARVKNIKNKKKFIEELKKIKIEEEKFDVNKFYLMKSELSEEGAIYKILEAFELG